jgi:predicted NBD/HSP70 family sugar kinase
MAYGELLKGAVKGEKDIVFINISWGLGSAFIIDGKIYTGRSGFSGEFATLSFSGNQLIISETYEENDELGYYKFETYTYLVEK